MFTRLATHVFLLNYKNWKTNYKIQQKDLDIDEFCSIYNRPDYYIKSLLRTKDFFLPESDKNLENMTCFLLREYKFGRIKSSKMIIIEYEINYINGKHVLSPYPNLANLDALDARMAKKITLSAHLFISEEYETELAQKHHKNAKDIFYQNISPKPWQKHKTRNSNIYFQTQIDPPRNILLCTSEETISIK